MKTSRSGAGGAFPSYDDFSEDDKRSNGINSIIAKYFAPTGLLALLILRSVVAPATPGGAATPHSDTTTAAPATPGTASTPATARTSVGSAASSADGAADDGSMTARGILRRTAAASAATSAAATSSSSTAVGDDTPASGGVSAKATPIKAMSDEQLKSYFERDMNRVEGLSIELHSRNVTEGERITALVHLTGDEIAAVNAYKRAAAEDESGKASTASDADWLRSTIRPTTTTPPPPATDWTTQLLAHGLTFVRELWNTAAKPMADTLLLTADTATAAIATESMILVQSCKAKYTELQVKLSGIYGQLSAAEDRLASTISLIQTTDQLMATAGDIYRNCKSMVHSCVAPDSSIEKIELVRNQALAAEKMKMEQEEMEILLASKKSQLDVKTTYKASILGCFQGFLAITSDTNRTSERSIQESPSTDKLTDLEPKALINDKSPQNASHLCTFLTSLLTKHPHGLATIVGPLLRVMEESRCGNLKSSPIDLSVTESTTPKGKDVIGTTGWTAEYYAKYVEQSKELWTFLDARGFTDCLAAVMPPHTIATCDGDISMRAVKGDVCMAIFKLLDMNEKTGWIERNAKREFMAHADTLLASEASLKKAITILREAIPDARRIATKVDFEVVRRCCVTMGRRDIVFQHTADKYIARSKDDDFHMIETDALDTLDHFLSEVSVICDDNIISDLSVSLVSADRIQEMEVCAVKALGGSWRQKSSHSNDSQHRRTGGGTGKSKKGGPKLTCAKPGCKSHLSKGIQKRAEQWAEDTGKDVSKHLCLCYKHYKETVAADMAGVEDAMTVTLTGGRSVTYSRKKDEYHACKRALQKEATAESPGKAPDYDAAELAEANAMLVKMLRASKATANEQPPTIEDVEPPAK
jgi:hypothetical protein